MQGRQGSVRSTDGTEIGWLETGDGPPLVLVHGTTADHSRWAPVLPDLAKHFTCFAIDRRGRGLSGDTDPYSIGREFEDVAAVIDAVGEPAVLVGHSYGALCALEAAARTASVSRMVLYEPPILEAPATEVSDTMRRIGELLDAEDREGALTLFMVEIVGLTDDELKAVRSSPSWQPRINAAHTIVREDEGERSYDFDPARFRTLEIPTLLLAGGISPPFLIEATLRLEKALPNARVVTMPGHGHAAITTAPGIFAREVLTFLNVG